MNDITTNKPIKWTFDKRLVETNKVNWTFQKQVPEHSKIKWNFTERLPKTREQSTLKWNFHKCLNYSYNMPWNFPSMTSDIRPLNWNFQHLISRERPVDVDHEQIRHESQNFKRNYSTNYHKPHHEYVRSRLVHESSVLKGTSRMSSRHGIPDGHGGDYALHIHHRKQSRPTLHRQITLPEHVRET